MQDTTHGTSLHLNPEQRAALETAFASLNPEQRAAVEALDGPVLVVAGPGTGKTQLLSLRVAAILQHRDVSPDNILCLTFSNAGSDAMLERLVGFIGRSAYGVTIGTFHAFSERLSARYPEYFDRSGFDRLITPLDSPKLINRLLRELPVTDPLYQNPFDGVSGNLGAVRSLMGKIKKSGLQAADILAICDQNLRFFDYFEREKAGLLQRLTTSLQHGTKEEKQRFLEDLKAELLVALDSAPAEFTEQLVTLTGSYEPYALLLRRVVQETCFFDENGNSSGFRKELRDRFFNQSPPAFKERRANAATRSVVSVYQRYQEYLKEMALYDYDDMILDAGLALEQHPSFAAQLRAQYQYILIDEFQDTNGAQMKIVESIIAGVERPNILAVGDDDQAIMRFQGASVEFIQQFEENYAGTRSIVLTKNYRSLPEIVALGQELAGQIEKRLTTSKESKHLEAVRQTAATPDLAPRVYAAPELQYYEVAREIKALIEGGFMERSTHPGSEIAILARKHASFSALIPYLEHFGIAFSYQVRREVSRIASLATLLALMRCVVHWSRGAVPRAEAELPRIVAAPELGIAQEDALRLAIEARSAGGWLAALEASSQPSLQRLYVGLRDVSAQVASVPASALIRCLSEWVVPYYEAHSEAEPFAVIELHYGLGALLEFVQGELQANSPKRRAALGLQAPIRLPSVVELLDETERFGVKIVASVPLGSTDAITLTTAHNSKGMEFDRVYLIDADRGSWTKPAGGAKLITQNIYLSESEDADDLRRVLFVAATRARDELCISLGNSRLVPELVGLATPRQMEVGLEALEDIAPLSWQDAYLPRPENLHLLQARAGRRLSVSLLNEFVEYREGGLDGARFLTNRLLALPSKPSPALDFGNIVHQYLAGYLNTVLKAGSTSEAELAAEARDALQALDYPPEELDGLAQRFELFLQHFMPAFKLRLTPDARAEQSFDVLLDGVPLTGRADLLLLDTSTQTIALYDYKTGAARSPGSQGAAYRRQLQFYKLLVENTPEFSGWRVSGGADLFVEPDRKQGLALPEEEFVQVGEEELVHLRRLIQAVWHRLQQQLFDTSGFLQSQQLADLRAHSVYKSNSGEHKKGDPKEPGAEELQRAYELWLIEEYEESTGQTA
ncbi:MAG: ATP-dependent helicase [Coriobacteriales bacterium]|jgi:DNA helicase-2/ATP-dependent DNA helicase PcrA|nr:ATP-dependent helicase [Coriobacteriales bacterium]